MIPLFAEFEWHRITGALALLSLAVAAASILWVMAIKRDPTSALAWCLLIALLPMVGPVLFFFFGYQTVHLPLRRIRQHADRFRPAPSRPDAIEEDALAAVAVSLGAPLPSVGNAVTLYHDGETAYAAMLAAIAGATHHVHVQFFIVRADSSGERFTSALAERARAGVQVRLLYDALGSWSLNRRLLRTVTEAGGKVAAFLTLLNPLRRRVQINLRNHRKIVVVDGRVAFTGGLNLGDEYLGKSPFFGPWRDMFLRVEGPAASDLQRVFETDWHFSTEEDISGPAFNPAVKAMGRSTVQIAASGPDQDRKTIREVYFAAILRAKTRVWLATPYFVPDAGILDALCMAARLGRDVRVLCPLRPDKWVPHLAGRYYWTDLLRAGVKVYQYTHGFLHLKLLIVDDDWSSVGTANLDNRSLHLNFEVTALIDSVDVQHELEAAYLRDLEQSIRLDLEVFLDRPFIAKMAENGARLFSPIL